MQISLTIAQTYDQDELIKMTSRHCEDMMRQHEVQLSAMNAIKSSEHDPKGSFHYKKINTKLEEYFHLIRNAVNQDN